VEEIQDEVQIALKALQEGKFASDASDDKGTSRFLLECKSVLCILCRDEPVFFSFSLQSLLLQTVTIKILMKAAESGCKVSQSSTRCVLHAQACQKATEG
jgi:hypothetical protein